jgi:hypothetical protein
MNRSPFSSAFSRRDFLKAGAVAATAAVLPRRLGATALLKPFEVSASTYAWELHDEGITTVLDNMQQMAAVNSVYLIGVMHPERRPFRDGDFPHNPVRKTWQAEDARCYWHPDLKRYGRVKPRLSDNAWLNETDWLRALVTETRKRGLKTGLECSHALIDKERMEGEFADLAQRNIRGEPTHVRDWLRPPCPNHPDTREYALALMSDAVASYDVDYVMSCIVSYDDGGPQRSGCFCPHCQRAAAGFGFDLKKIQAALLADARSQPALGEWEEFRFRATADFYRFLHAGLRAVKPTIELRYNVHMTARNPLAWGVNLPLMAPHLGSARIMDYSEQDGAPARMSGKREWLSQLRREVGPKFPLLSALGVRLKATPELVHEGVKIAVETGMDGITLGHYDGATFPILRAVREGLVAAGQRV